MTGCPLRRVLALNNRGVHHLQKGHLRQAALSLVHAMDCFQKVTVQQEVVVPHEQQGSFLQVTSVPLDEDTLLQNALAVSPHNLLDVYPYAFAVSRLGNDDDDMSFSDTRTELAIVLLYNLGATHHFLALRGEPQESEHQQDDHFHQALRFYQRATVLFQAQQQDNQAAVLGAILALPLALLNNLGHVLSHYCQTTEAQYCAAVVDELLTQGAAYLSDEEAEFFAATVAYGTDFGALLAPAA